MVVLNAGDTYKKETETLEILLSTMHRKDLAFLDHIFQYTTFNEVQILIINQTTPDTLLQSSLQNIRVINSFEKGLSKSRNLALQHAIGDICLLADDDTYFIEGFDRIIQDSFKKYSQAAVITFQIRTFEGRAFRAYGGKPKMAKTPGDIADVCSIEIAFRRNAIINNGISFNELFGLNSYFPMAEEYLFVRDALRAGLTIWYVPCEIVAHSQTTSTSDYGNDRVLYTKGALAYIDYRSVRIFYLLKFIFFLARKRYISWREVFLKFSVGLKGARDYKKLTHQSAA